MDRRISRLLLMAAALLLPCLTAQAQVTENQPEVLSHMGVDEHPGEFIPLDLRFANDRGDTVALAGYFEQERPVVMALYYSDCPMLCSMVLNALQKTIGSVDLKPGKDYRLLTVSIDPKETIEKNRAGHERFAALLPEGTPDEAWTFFSGSDSSIEALSKALGFRYFYDEKRDEFAHPAVIFVLTPEGRISRYLYGLDYKPRDLRMALLEASGGKIGTTVDRILLYCYHYDPDAGGYVIMATNIMRLGGATTLGVLSLLLIGLWIKEAKKRPAHNL